MDMIQMVFENSEFILNEMPHGDSFYHSKMKSQHW